MSFIYSVKFVCGIQNPSTACTPVRQGAYSTEINIHNFHQPGGNCAHSKKYSAPRQQQPTSRP